MNRTLFIHSEETQDPMDAAKERAEDDMDKEKRTGELNGLSDAEVMLRATLKTNAFFLEALKRNGVL